MVLSVAKHVYCGQLDHVSVVGLLVMRGLLKDVILVCNQNDWIKCQGVVSILRSVIKL